MTKLVRDEPGAFARSQPNEAVAIRQRARGSERIILWAATAVGAVGGVFAATTGAGWLLLAIVLPYLFLFGWGVTQVSAATRPLLAGKPVEAERVARRALRVAIGAEIRGALWMKVGAALARQGRLVDALAAYQYSLRILPRRARVIRLMVDLEVVCTLCDLERAQEARSYFEQLPEGDEGSELVRYDRILARLYLAFALDDVTLLGKAVDEIARQSMLTTRAGKSIALCAWAFERRGDPEMARHLLEQATPDRFLIGWEVASPKLAAWFSAAKARLCTAEQAHQAS